MPPITDRFSPNTRRMGNRLKALGLALLLAACGKAGVVPEPAVSFRTAGAPIGSTLRGTAADLNGDWQVASGYPGGVVQPGDRLTLQLDGSGAGVARVTSDGTARLLPVSALGAGRWKVGTEVWWLLWTDDTFRTAVIGQPDGGIGWIMNRPGAASGDRTRAAREMLDFNGYDTGALVVATGG